MKSIKSLFPFQKKPKCHDESVDDRRSFRQTSFRNPPINPYSVITEPKTKKATRSLPGGRINTSSRHNNTMYENLANNEFQRRQKIHAQQQILRHSSIKEVDEVPHRILIPNNYHTQLSSEYGSMAEDPSPTNPYSRNNHSFESSDSEPENDIEAFYRNLYEKNMRKIERKKNKAERVAKNAETAYYKLFYEFEELKNRSTKMVRLLENYKVENSMLRTRVEELEKSRQAALHSNDPIVYGGAPEAMCSISEINPNSIGYPPRHIQNYNTHDNNEQDEVKIFANKEECELPRSASNSYHLQPEDLAPATIKLELDETLYLNGKIVEQDKHVVHFQNNSKHYNQENKEPTSPNQEPVTNTINQLSYEQPIKRSFSDSDLRDLRLVASEDAREEEKEMQHRNGRNNRLRKGTTRYVKADQSSSYSSDDDRIRDAIQIQTRQLKPRGEVVHFRPSRRSILNKGTNVFRRFGPNERKAIAEFDYLNDLSTNSSGLE